MKFVSIPQNGASWREPLLYAFDTESTTPTDVVFEIVDLNTRKTLGKIRLYSVTSGSFNIAPYLCNEASLAPHYVTEPTIMRSPASMNVAVKCGNTTSNGRVFYAGSFNATFFCLLSHTSACKPIAYGETIYLSLYAKNSVSVDMSILFEDSIQQSTLKHNSYNQPADIIIPLYSLDRGAQEVRLTISCDDTRLCTLRYKITDRNSTARQLIWRNRMGGLESYTFPTTLPQRMVAESYTTQCYGENHSHINKCYKDCVLASSLESNDDMEHIAEIICSPHIYEVTGEGINEIELIKREVDYTVHGAIRQLKLNVRDTIRFAI